MAGQLDQLAAANLGERARAAEGPEYVVLMLLLPILRAMGPGVAALFCRLRFPASLSPPKVKALLVTPEENTRLPVCRCASSVLPSRSPLLDKRSVPALMMVPP